MINLKPIGYTAPSGQETSVDTTWGEFYARMYPAAEGWLAHAVFYISNVEITRYSPTALSEGDAAAWIQRAFDDGPFFIVPLLEAHHAD